MRVTFRILYMLPERRDEWSHSRLQAAVLSPGPAQGGPQGVPSRRCRQLLRPDDTAAPEILRTDARHRGGRPSRLGPTRRLAARASPCRRHSERPQEHHRPWLAWLAIHSPPDPSQVRQDEGFFLIPWFESGTFAPAVQTESATFYLQCEV